MNRLVKLAVAGALSLGATSAFAALGAPWSNSSDLVLVIENASTHDTYSFDTGQTLDSILPTGSLVTGASLNTSIPGLTLSLSVSQLTGLSAFLAANPASGDLWTLEGGQWNGNSTNSAGALNNTRPAGAGKAIFTSLLGTGNNANVPTKNVANMNSFLNGIQADITQNTGALFGLQTATNFTCTACTTAGAEARYGFWTAIDWASLGSTSMQLFGFTGNGTAGALQSYIMGSATLDANGNLSILPNQTGAVPLPAAVWLFGSGLLGLFGVARRRAAAA
jgi:hypothetical protein